MKLSYPDFSAKWHDRFRPNTTFNIAEADFQEFALDIVDTFGVSVTNVPEYLPGTTYTVGFLVRYTPARGQEAFYYSLNAGKLTAPGPSNLTDWKVVPGPTTATALSQQITLVQAQGIDNDQVVAGRTYLIEFGLNVEGYMQTIAVRGVSNNSFDVEGTLEVNGRLTPVKDVDVQAGTWQVKQYGGSYTNQQARAAQLNRTATAGTTTVTLTAESPVDYGTAASGTITVDPAGAVPGKGARFGLSGGANPPNFLTPAGALPYQVVGSYVAGKKFNYSLYVCSDVIQVVITQL